MSVEKILNSWKKKSFSPVYWLEGEEDFYIDQITAFAEHQILPEQEAAFNLTVFYGRDADWASVINSCRRYPMFAERQVVLLKEAQHMKDLDKLESYISAPLASTVLVIALKGSSTDKRTKLFKLLQSHTVYFKSAKIKDNKVAEWIKELVASKGLTIKPNAAILLEEHIGNDLNRLANEVEKLQINLKNNRNEITEDDIETYIGISKEYNVFELQAAIAFKNLAKAMQIIQYFESNPKAGPIQRIFPALYSNFSKIISVYGLTDKSDAVLKPMFYYNPDALSQAKAMMKNYGQQGLEKLILLLHLYNLKSVGIGDSGTEGSTLLKEMMVKIME